MTAVFAGLVYLMGLASKFTIISLIKLGGARGFCEAGLDEPWSIPVALAFGTHVIRSCQSKDFC